MANIKREWELTVEWGRALNSYWLSCMFVLARLDIKYSHAIVIWYINARLRFEFCIYLLVLQFTPSKPGLHSHRYEFTSSMHFPLFRHGVCTQSSISENKQFRDNIYIIQLLFFAKKNIKLRFLVCSIIPCIFYFKVLSLDWQLIYKRILIQSLTDFAVFSFKTMFAFTPIWIHFINAFSFIQARCSFAVINIWKQTIPLQMFCWNW